MRLTTRTRYAVRALVYLGSQCNKRSITLKEIAENEDIAEKYLEQILRRLNRAGLVRTNKGPGGGYILGKPLKSIKLSDILSAVGESYAPVFCVDDQNKNYCLRIKCCPVRPLWQDLKRILEDFLKNHTLGDVCKKS